MKTIEQKAEAYDKVREKIALRFGSDVVKEIFSEFEESEDERMRKFVKYAVDYLFDNKKEKYICNTHKDEVVAWLEKQVKKKSEQKSKNVSLWKHWKGGGVAGGIKGEQIFLIKNGNTYSISSCLGFECDYIELSELDNHQ